MAKNYVDSDMEKQVLSIIDNVHPQSVKELAIVLKKTCNYEEEKIIMLISKMQAEGKIVLINRESRNIGLLAFLRSDSTIWYWITIAVSAFATLLFILVSDTSYPVVYARNIMGLAFILFLPGYSLSRILFPKPKSNFDAEKLGPIERIVVSIATSVVLAVIIGLVTYFFMGTLHISLIVFGILAITVSFASASLIGDYLRRFE